MNCQDVRARAYEYFERQLAESVVTEIDLHVGACAQCGELWAIAREMTCRDFGDGCGEFAERTLSPERKRLFERHLSICRACVEYLASYERTIALARASHEVDESALQALEERLIASILAARKRRA